MPKQENLIFVINANYIGQFKVTFRSVADSHPGIGFHLHMLISRLSPEQCADVSRFVTALGSDVTFYEIDDSLFRWLPQKRDDDRYAAYYKVLIPYYLAHLDRALYLDCDIIVRGDLMPLFRLPADTFLAAVADGKINRNRPEHVARITGRLDVPYFNSGVLLFTFGDGSHMIPREELLRYMTEHRADIRWHDQDILNHFYATDCTILDEKYNYVTTYCSIADALLPLGRRRGDVVHYANWKPWKPDYIGKCYRLYRRYYRACAGEAGVDFLQPRRLGAQLKLVKKYLCRGARN